MSLNPTVDAGGRRVKAAPLVTPGWISYSLLALALLCVGLGIALRFANLGARSYTNDEATTSIRSAGSSLGEWSRLFDGRVRTVAELRRYQTVVPQRSTADTVRALALEDPQHPPLYYVLERWWIAIAGDTVGDRRALSAVFGVLAIGAAFMLAAEAGRSVRAGIVCAALMAVSPFFIAYSQHAREYALWALEVLLATWLLLRAIRSRSLGPWLGYTVVTALGLYTDLLYAAVLIGHAVIALALARQRRRVLAAWAVSVVAALVAFAPWLVAVVGGAGILTNNAFLGAKLPLLVFVAKWVFNAAVVFVDLEYRHPAAILLVPAVLLLCAAAAFIVARPPRVPGALVAGALIVPPALVMIVLDLLHHESRSTASRYLTPAWVGLELLVALAIGAVLASRRPGARVGGMVAFAFLAIAGGASTLAESRADWSWVDSSVAPIRPVVAILDAASHPLVVYKGDAGAWDFKVMQLVNVLRPDVRIELVAPSAPLSLPPNERTVFLLDASPAVRAEARRGGLTLRAAYLGEDRVGAGLTGAFRSRAQAARKQDKIPEEPTSLWRVEAGAPVS